MTALARWTSIGVAIVGLAIALYLTVVHYSGAEAFCGIGHACVTVQRSAYSELAGVPVALLGVLTYGALLGALLHDGDAARRVVSTASTVMHTAEATHQGHTASSLATSTYVSHAEKPKPVKATPAATRRAASPSCSNAPRRAP